AALDSTPFDESALERARLTAVRESFDGGHAPAVGLQRQERARVHRPPVDQHHAGAALGVVAALFCAREAELVAKRRQQRSRAVYGDRVCDAVDREGEWVRHRRARSYACSRARLTTTGICARR